MELIFRSLKSENTFGFIFHYGNGYQTWLIWWKDVIDVLSAVNIASIRSSFEYKYCCSSFIR